MGSSLSALSLVSREADVSDGRALQGSSRNTAVDMPSICNAQICVFIADF